LGQASVLVLARLTQEVVRVPLAKRGVGDDAVHLSVDRVALPENLDGDERVPQREGNRAGGVGGDVRSPERHGADEVVPANGWGAGEDAVKEIGDPGNGRNGLPPARRAPVVIRVMGLDAVVGGGDVLPENGGDLDGSIGEIRDGFVAGRPAERVGVSSVVSAVGGDDGKVEGGALVEDRVFDT
jgi:hypothetical protein